MWDKFVVYDQQRVMLLDSLSSTHPVSAKVDNAAQISQIFDDISYRKGRQKKLLTQSNANLF